MDTQRNRQGHMRMEAAVRLLPFAVLVAGLLLCASVSRGGAAELAADAEQAAAHPS